MAGEGKSLDQTLREHDPDNSKLNLLRADTNIYSIMDPELYKGPDISMFSTKLKSDINFTNNTNNIQLFQYLDAVKTKATSTAYNLKDDDIHYLYIVPTNDTTAAIKADAIAPSLRIQLPLLKKPTGGDSTWTCTQFEAHYKDTLLKLTNPLKSLIFLIHIYVFNAAEAEILKKYAFNIFINPTFWNILLDITHLSKTVFRTDNPSLLSTRQNTYLHAIRSLQQLNKKGDTVHLETHTNIQFIFPSSTGLLIFKLPAILCLDCIISTINRFAAAIKFDIDSKVLSPNEVASQWDQIAYDFTTAVTSSLTLEQTFKDGIRLVASEFSKFHRRTIDQCLVNAKKTLHGFEKATERPPRQSKLLRYTPY